MGSIGNAVSRRRGAGMNIEFAENGFSIGCRGPNPNYVMPESGTPYNPELHDQTIYRNYVTQTVDEVIEIVRQQLA